MTIQTFIEKAIEGGWKPYSQQNSDWRDGNDVFHSTHVDSIFLDPLAWQAVGKVEGWKECPMGLLPKDCQLNHTTGYVAHMHRMIDVLASGKSIEEFLATL